MSCLHPTEGFRRPDGTVRHVGARSDAAVMRAGYLVMPCGRCRWCRVERSRQWAVRMMHEAQMHEENSFITLTYSDEHLPTGSTLRVRDWQLFLKRLRKRTNKRISFFHCGEYGEDNGRPHYHAALFGESFRNDLVELPKTQKGHPQWTNALLDETWRKGRASAAHLTFESAQYVAKYITVKRTGPGAAAHYAGRRPEYSTMSKNPAIGKRWFERFWRDVYPSDEVVVEGRKGKPPKYYDRLLEEMDPALLEEIKEARRENNRKRLLDETHERREVRAELLERRAETFTRRELT